MLVKQPIYFTKLKKRHILSSEMVNATMKAGNFSLVECVYKL